MSEPTQASAPPRGKGKKILGMSQGQLLIVLGVALVGGAFLLYRSRKKAAAAQQAQASACPDGSAPDANGNCAQTGQDWSGAIDTLQTEIADLQGAMAAQGAGGGSGSGTVGGSTGTTTTPPPTTTTPPTVPSVPTGGGGGFKAAGPIAGLQATGTTSTGFTVRWSPATGATGGYKYIVRDLAAHTQVRENTVKGTTASVSGLKPGTDYNFGVQALPGGPGTNIHVRTKR